MESFVVKSRACSSHVGQLGKRPPRSARDAEAVSSSGSSFGVALVQTQRHVAERCANALTRE
jgi:hypothetical protein